MKIAPGHLGLTTDRVGVQGVAAVDDDVAGLHGIGQLADDRIGGGAGLHHDQGAAGALQGGDELLDGGGGDEAAGLAELGDEGIRFRRCAVVHGDRVAVAGEVSGDVGAHHCQADDTDLSGGISHGPTYYRPRRPPPSMPTADPPQAAETAAPVAAFRPPAIELAGRLTAGRGRRTTQRPAPSHR